MAIENTDIKIYKTANGLGGAITNTELVSAQSNNIFDKFTGAETKAGGVFYACFYIKNEHATLTAEAVEVILQSESVHAGVNVSLAKGSAAVNAEEQTIDDENTAPVGVTFLDTDTTSAGDDTPDPTLVVGDIPKGEYQSFWARYTIDADTAAITGYAVDFDIDYDSAA